MELTVAKLPVHGHRAVDCAMVGVPLLQRLCFIQASVYLATSGCLAQLNSRAVVFLACCLTSKQHDSVSQGPICSDNCTCCHTETKVADQILYLTQSQYTNVGPTSSRADLITPRARQGCHRMTRPGKPLRKQKSTLGLPLSRRTP